MELSFEVWTPTIYASMYKETRASSSLRSFIRMKEKYVIEFATCGHSTTVRWSKCKMSLLWKGSVGTGETAFSDLLFAVKNTFPGVGEGVICLWKWCEISINLPLRASNLKEIKFKTFPPLIPFLFYFWGGAPRSKQWTLGRRKKGVCRIWRPFLGSSERVSHLWKSICMGSPPHLPLQMDVISRGRGWAAPTHPRPSVDGVHTNGFPRTIQ